MGDILFFIVFGIVALLFIYVIYWAVVITPRLRKQFKTKAEAQGWTYTSDPKGMRDRAPNSFLISPEELVYNRIQGNTQGIHWQIEQIGFVSKMPNTNKEPESALTIIWHSEDVRSEHGSVVLFPKAEGWSSCAGDGALKAEVKAVYSELAHDLMRATLNIQNTPITLNIPEFDAKYRIDVSDAGAASALTSEVRDFLIQHNPPVTMIFLSDHALGIFPANGNYFANIEDFDKLDALVDYCVQLAQVIAASQKATSAQQPASSTL